MSNKSNKSFTKRIKVTSKGKLIARSPGGNHFNSKESRKIQLSRKRQAGLSLPNKVKARFLPHHNTNNDNKLGKN